MTPSRAIVIGSGPNGMAAAILLARSGYAVTVLEGSSTYGGGARSAELTLSGFVHDVCSAVHPMAATSPCFDEFPLAQHGLEWVHAPLLLAHPFDDGSAVVLHRSIDATAANLGADGPEWRRIFEPMAAEWPGLRHDVLAPPLRIPTHPIDMARFGFLALHPARSLALGHFEGTRARALFAGLAAHSLHPLDAPATSGIALVLAAAGHVAGWPFPRGGTQRISDALAACLRSHGGEIVLDSAVTSLPDAPLVMCDVTPRQFLSLAGVRLPDPYRRALIRYRYGPGVFKMDWALSGPIPWRAEECHRAGTVHVGGTLEEIAAWERDRQGRPFLILSQPSLFDPTRAPAGKHTAWAYCHTPNGSTDDFSGAIEEQIERFAPGFGELILARNIFTPAALERYNPNLVGGDIGGGAMSLRQIFFRPTRHLYRTPITGVYLCSSATPPGGGVHGMCGYHAVHAALDDTRRAGNLPTRVSEPQP